MLEYKLSEGFRRNILVDLQEQKIFDLSTGETDIKSVLREYVDYYHAELKEPEYEYLNPLSVELIEFRDGITDFDLAIQLITGFHAKFLMIPIEHKENFKEFVNKMVEHIKAESTPLNRIYLIVDHTLYEELKTIKLPILFQLLTVDYINFKRIVALKNFIPSIEVVCENQTYNSFYNERLIIDNKIYKKLKTAFQGLTLNDPEQLLHELDMKYDVCKYWKVNKKQVKVCRDCEFKDICVDASELKSNQSALWERVSECNYNPYICKWIGEKGYLTLKESIEQGKVTEDYINRIE